MTQPADPGAIVPAGTPQAPETPDEIQRILQDLDNDFRRFEASPVELSTIHRFLKRTIAEYLKDAFNQIREVRDYAVELDDGLRKLEASNGDGELETQLLPEDAEKFTALIEGVVMIINLITGSGNQAPETMKALGELKQIADDCRKILEESTLEMEEEEEEEPDGESSGKS